MAATDDHAQNERASDYPRSDNEQYVANNRGSCQTSRHPTTPLFPPRKENRGWYTQQKIVGLSQQHRCLCRVEFIQGPATHQATPLRKKRNPGRTIPKRDIRRPRDWTTQQTRRLRLPLPTSKTQQTAVGAPTFSKSPPDSYPRRAVRICCDSSDCHFLVLRLPSIPLSPPPPSPPSPPPPSLNSEPSVKLSSPLAPHPVQYSHHLRNHQQLTIAIDCFLPFALRIPYCKIELVCLCLRFQLFIGFRNEHGLFLHKVNSRSE